MASSSSKHDPIEHFITWDRYVQDIRYYGDVPALVRNIGRIPRAPGTGTIRYFHSAGCIDITEALQDYCQRHPQVIQDLISLPAAQITAQRQQLTDAIHAMLEKA